MVFFWCFCLFVCLLLFFCLFVVGFLFVCCCCVVVVCFLLGGGGGGGGAGITAIGVSIDRESTTLFNICCFVPNLWRELFGLETFEAKIVCACVNIHLLQKFNWSFCVQICLCAGDAFLRYL